METGLKITWAFLAMFLIAYGKWLLNYARLYWKGRHIPAVAHYPILGTLPLFPKNIDDWPYYYLKWAKDARQRGAGMMAIWILGELWVAPLDGETTKVSCGSKYLLLFSATTSTSSYSPNSNDRLNIIQMFPC